MLLGNTNGSTSGIGSHHSGLSQSPHIVLEGTNHSSSNTTDVDIPPEAQPPAPSATLVENLDIHECSDHDRRELTVNHIPRSHLASHQFHADCFQGHERGVEEEEADYVGVSSGQERGVDEGEEAMLVLALAKKEVSGQERGVEEEEADYVGVSSGQERGVDEEEGTDYVGVSSGQERGVDEEEGTDYVGVSSGQERGVEEEEADYVGVSSGQERGVEEEEADYVGVSSGQERGVEEEEADYVGVSSGQERGVEEEEADYVGVSSGQERGVEEEEADYVGVSSGQERGVEEEEADYVGVSSGQERGVEEEEADYVGVSSGQERGVEEEEADYVGVSSGQERGVEEEEADYVGVSSGQERGVEEEEADYVGVSSGQERGVDEEEAMLVLALARKEEEEADYVGVSSGQERGVEEEEADYVGVSSGQERGVDEEEAMLVLALARPNVIQLTSDADGSSVSQRETEDVKVKFETLRAMEQAETIDINSHLSDRVSDHNVGEDEHTMHTMMITPELLGLIPSSSGQSGAQSPSLSSDVSSDAGKCGIMGPKTWTQEDMELALDALRNHNMSLTKASATYGIPSTTLWQRAHRMGIDTPKKEGPTKSWTEENLNSALEALRTGSISANKASKAYDRAKFTTLPPWDSDTGNSVMASKAVSLAGILVCTNSVSVLREGSDENVRVEFWNVLCGLGERIILLEDMNEWMGTQKENSESVLRRYGDDRVDENS
uniref:HTH psq-type domain-containing protein n=1 Tax=Timema shepardi TaxID=629360 RepID=A0A7R9G3I8_TIMSH|nr:unnamed protein product [Timema shepardi]